MIRRLGTTNTNYQITNAVDGLHINREDYADRLEQYHSKKGSCFRLRHNKARFAGKLSPGEIGCYLSHYNLWKKIVDKNIPAAVILEDDAEPNPDFTTVISEIASCDWQWDLVYLHRDCSDKIYRILQPLSGGYRLTQLAYTPPAACAYLISKEGAHKLLEHCYLMHHGLDVVWKDFWNWNGRVYAVCPNPVRQLYPASTIIQTDSLSETEKFADKTPIWLLISRVVRKWKISAIKRWSYWRFHPQKKGATQ